VQVRKPSEFPALLAVAISAASVGCAPTLGDGRVRDSGNDRSAAFGGAGRIEITEHDATVAASVAPLVLSAGPSALFVSSSSARCPEDMALADDRICVDRWEASIVRLVGTGVSGKKEVGWSPYEKLDQLTGSYRAVSRPAVVPQGYISGRQAERACRASGKRLCTASEWEVGCRGPRRAQFPYGNERRANVCNDDLRARHPVMEAARREGVFGERVWRDGMNLAIINQLPDTLAKTGERAECVNEDGVFDMVGNLHEWVADADGTFRGGYYMDTTQNGDGCSYRTSAHDFEYHDYSTGFRCCADPESLE